MRIGAGSGNLGDPRQHELRRHLKMMSRFIDTAAPGASLTMVLRSAGSDPAKTLVGLKGALQRVGAVARVILAKLEPELDLKQLFAALSELAPHAPAHELIRWARNPRLLDAHEQVTYGDAMCWSGDAMRRDAERRNVLVLFDEDAAAVRLGRQAFAALWQASVPVPAHRLAGNATVRPSGAYEQPADPAVAPATLRRPLQLWPLLRH